MALNGFERIAFKTPSNMPQFLYPHKSCTVWKGLKEARTGEKRRKRLTKERKENMENINLKLLKKRIVEEKEAFLKGDAFLFFPTQAYFEPGTSRIKGKGHNCINQ